LGVPDPRKVNTVKVVILNIPDYRQFDPVVAPIGPDGSLDLAAVHALTEEADCLHKASSEAKRVRYLLQLRVGVT